MHLRKIILTTNLLILIAYQYMPDFQINIL
jgi:hypothetical protein